MVKKKFDFKTMHLKDIPKFAIAFFKGEVGDEEEMMTTQTGFYEINLVPDVKTEMIKTQKVRNLVFFICIIISIASVSTVAVLGSVKGAQDLTMTGQDKHLKNLSSKILGYDELAEFLTVQNQINGVSKIEDNQKVLSRAVSFLNSLLPSGADKIEVSELSIDLTESTLTFDAQANAGKEPYIDYRVLEAFMKRTNLMTFDYGRYVDSTGNNIPSRCIEEYDPVSGKMHEENGSIYAIWKRGEKGCDPTPSDNSNTTEGSATVTITDTSVDATKMVNGQSRTATITGRITTSADSDGNQTRVIEYIPSEKIYRTPQFTSWHNGDSWDTSKDGVDDVIIKPGDEATKVNITNHVYTPVMGLDGSISGIPHFDSKCITYSGEETEENGKKNVKWSANNECQLVPDGIVINSSSNGRDTDDNLVLRFSALVKINADAFAFRNKHIMAIGPNSQNVTDSYVQLEKIFAAPATDCSAGDTECQNARTTGE
ncbi:hypothetical protein IJI76_02055 [Candidatus Saccharibacteria bacterium]|nr:hypothetical protein [Candidatus Saccharibacteria bacterium]